MLTSFVAGNWAPYCSLHGTFKGRNKVEVYDSAFYSGHSI